MKKKLSQGLIQGFSILQKKYEAERRPNQMQSARKLVQEQYVDEYGLANNKVRSKKEGKHINAQKVIETMQSRKQSNSKIKIDIKTPLVEVTDHKSNRMSSRQSKKSEDSSNTDDFNDDLRSGKITKTNSIISKSSKKGQQAEMKNILGRLSKGDQEKQKYLLELCRQNLNEKLHNNEDIFGKNALNVSRSSLQKEKQQKELKASKIKFFSNPESKKQTATCTNIPNSMENSYVQEQQKHKNKIIINPSVFNYEQKPRQKTKSIKPKLIKGKNCYTQGSVQ